MKRHLFTRAAASHAVKGLISKEIGWYIIWHDGRLVEALVRVPHGAHLRGRNDYWAQANSGKGSSR